MIQRLPDRWNDSSLRTRARLVLAGGFCSSALVLYVAIEAANRMPDSAPMWPLILGFGVLGALSLLGVFWFVDQQTARVNRLGDIANEMSKGAVSGPVMAESRDELGVLQTAMIDASRTIAEHRGQLSETKRFLEHIISTGPVVVFREQVPELTLTYLSPNASRILDVDPEALVGRPAILRDLVRADHRSRVVDAISQLASGRIDRWRGVVARAVRGVSEQRWLEMELWLDATAGDGTPRSVLGYVADITDRVELEATAVEATMKYQSLFERIPTGIFRTTLEGEIEEVNPAFASMLGYPDPQTLLESPLRASDLYLDPDVRERFLEELLDQGSVTGFEAEVRRADGETLWVSLDATAIYEGRDQPMIEGSAVDITARRRAEHRARTARIEADRANRAKSDFLSRMSHELRTPLNSIIGFSQLLEMRSLDDRDRDGVRQIHRAGNHLLTLINEVLDIARVESGRLDVSVEPVEVAPLIADAVELMRPMAEARHLDLHVESVNGAWVMADQQRLKQVLLNLLSNAVKYNHRNGEIIVAVTPADDTISISIADTGPGIPADRLDRLFVPFDRLGAEHGPEEGTGLGMVLSQNLVKAMNGDLTVASRLGEGTTVSIRLESTVRPSISDADQMDLETAARTIDASDTRTVLYIEDNTANLNLVLEVLALRPDIELIPAINGQLGLDLARQHHPDVILLDLNLPGISGSDVLRELKVESSTRDIPVIVLSADATPRQIRHLRQAGADAYLTKPLDINLFLETLDRTLAVLV